MAAIAAGCSKCALELDGARLRSFRLPQHARLLVLTTLLWIPAGCAVGEGAPVHSQRESELEPTLQAQTPATGAAPVPELVSSESAPMPEDFARYIETTPAVGQPCPPAGAGAEEEMAEQAKATIPLIVGMTLSHQWVPPAGEPNGGYERECLQQVVAVEPDRIVVSETCPMGPDATELVSGIHQYCRVDLRDGRTFLTTVGEVVPELQEGATGVVLSNRQFREIQETGALWFRHVEMEYAGHAPSEEAARPIRVTDDVYGRLELSWETTLSVLVNDEQVELPVLFLMGSIRKTKPSPDESAEEGVLTLAVLNDERAPIVLELQRFYTSASLRYTKITYPERSEIERELIEDRRAVVYGIYFAFNSATIRPESEVVLREIGQLLDEHPDWNLLVEGHTDSVGGDVYNLELSQRRAEAVREWLIASGGIEGSRLTTGGYGESLPKADNDTEEGRARNRRVELVRQ